MHLVIPWFVAASIVAMASCSDSTNGTVPPVADAASETSASEEDAAAGDAGIDASPGFDGYGGAFDAGPPPIVCTQPPCASSLVTTSGYGGFCALLDDGTVACWGENFQGQLGRGPAGSETVTSATPERVVGLTNIVRLARTCATDQEGATWCWGTGPFLRSPSSASTTEHTPVKLDVPQDARVSIQFATGLGTIAAVGCALEGSQVACWGTNKNGQVHPPVIGESTTGPTPPTPIAIPSGAAIEDIFVGEASFVLRRDGTLLSWGANPPLGRVSSLFPDSRAIPLELTGVSYIDVDEGNVCAVAQGSAYCWGRSKDSVVDPLSYALPQRIDTPEPVVSVATASVETTSATQRGCACGVSGDVYCWGPNKSGQAGDGTRQYAVKPVKVKGLPAPAAQVRTAPLATCALLTTGKIYCWGENGFGELGNGYLRDPSLDPVEVLLPSN